MLSDGFSSSEALGMGNSVMTKDSEVQTAKFMLGERCKVFDENDQPVEPGSGRSGMVAIGPPNPLGYYKDDEKTARTFRTINGVRYSIPGDWCIVEADGTLTLLGRGSACINTAGEKVFPEEVEEALKAELKVCVNWRTASAWSAVRDMLTTTSPTGLMFADIRETCSKLSCSVRTGSAGSDKAERVAVLIGRMFISSSITMQLLH
jgi:acyl-CoA synthetase (AMP-forming)/AMP-acid ligase II